MSRSRSSIRTRITPVGNPRAVDQEGDGCNPPDPTNKDKSAKARQNVQTYILIARPMRNCRGLPGKTFAQHHGDWLSRSRSSIRIRISISSRGRIPSNTKTKIRSSGCGSCNGTEMFVDSRRRTISSRRRSSTRSMR